MLASLVPGETLQVLLVSAQEGMRVEVGKALAGRVGDYRLHWVSQPDLALVRAMDVLPHVILVDDDLGGVNPAHIVGQIASQFPETAVLVLLAGDAMTLAREVVLAGARGFISKPLKPEELVTALRQVLAKVAVPVSGQMPVIAGRVVVFCSPKGGTGRTTLAINTAITLREISNQDVVLVDADYAAPAVDVALNINSSANITALLPKLARLDADLIHQVLATHKSGIRVLLAPPPADLSTSIPLPDVQRVLVWLKRMFAWVVVDLGLPLDETAFGFLDGADRIVMCVLPELVGLRNTRLMIDQFYERGYPLQKVWLVLNRATLKGGLSQRDIGDRLRVSIKHTIPDDQALTTYAINRGVPFVMSHPRSPLARAVRELAQQLVAEVSAPALEEGRQAGKGVPKSLRSIP